MRLECAPGSHTITFEYRNDSNIISSKSLYVTVLSGRETTISGNIEEKEITSGGSSVPTSETKPIEVKQNEATTVSVSVAPVQPSSSTEPQNKTTVTFPAGSFTADSANAVLNLSVKSAGEFSVTSPSEPDPVASIDISLKVNEQSITSFNNEYVEITTYILAGLENVQVKYTGEGDQPILVSYNIETGELVFKTNHFSEYIVVANVEALNVSTGIPYTKLVTAIEEAKNGENLKLMKDVTLNEVLNINKGIKFDLNNKVLNLHNCIYLNTSSERYGVEFLNGTIRASISNYGAGNSAINLNGDTSISLNNVVMTSNIVGIFAMNNQNNISITLNNSSLTTNGYYAIGTNAKQPDPSYNVTMIIKNSNVTVDRSSDTSSASSKDGDSTAICFNVKGSVIIENSIIKADRQAIMLRGGEGHLIKDSILETTGANNISSEYISSAWRSGNEVPLAALVIGNRSGSAYNYPTSVKLDNVTLKAPEKNKADKPYYGIYVYQCKQSDGNSHHVSVEGTISDSSTNKIVNPIMSDEGISIAKFDVSGAEFTVKTSAEMEAALDVGGTVKILNDIDISETLKVTKTVTLDMNNNKIYNTSDIWNDETGDWSLISVREGGNLTIKGNGTLDAKENDCFAVDVYDEDAVCTIENGVFNGNLHSVYAYEGTIVIKGGKFDIKQKQTSGDPYGYVLNCLDSSYANRKASFEVSGGEFHKYNPASSASENPVANFVVSGKTTTKEGDWYKVVDVSAVSE